MAVTANLVPPLPRLRRGIPSKTGGVLPHHRLDAYRLSLQFAKEARRLAGLVPRGSRKVADHLKRSGEAPVMLVAEAANRYTRGTKRLRFEDARGEVGEAQAAAEYLVYINQLPQAEIIEFFDMASRLSRMLYRLVQRFS